MQINCLALNVVILKPGDKPGDSARWFPAKKDVDACPLSHLLCHSPLRYLHYFSCPSFVHTGDPSSRLSPKHIKAQAPPHRLSYHGMTSPQGSTLKRCNKFSMARNSWITCQAGARQGRVYPPSEVCCQQQSATQSLQAK